MKSRNAPLIARRHRPRHRRNNATHKTFRRTAGGDEREGAAAVRLPAPAGADAVLVDRRAVDVAGRERQRRLVCVLVTVMVVMVAMVVVVVGCGGVCWGARL